MNQRNPQNVSHLNVNLNFMVVNLTQDKTRTMISVNMSVKNK